MSAENKLSHTYLGNPPCCASLSMSIDCSRGDWNFRLDAALNPRLGPFVIPTGHRDTPQSPFWAEINDGVHVHRSPLGYSGQVTFFYRSEDFCIGFSTVFSTVAGVEALQGLAPNEHQSDQSLQFFFEGSESWVDHMTMDQYEDFILAVLDSDLYKCLLECVPEEWLLEVSPYRSWAARGVSVEGTLLYVSPVAPAIAQEGRLGAEKCFGFLRTMISLKAWRPKSSTTGIYQRDIEDLLQGRKPSRWSE
jgi:hypothetical protein